MITSPLDISGCFLWLDAGQGFTPALWTDQSSEHNDVVQATQANQPIYIASEATLGGRPALDFRTVTGNIKWMKKATFSQAIATPSTLFVVCGATVGNTAVVDGVGAAGRQTLWSDSSFGRVSVGSSSGFSSPQLWTTAPRIVIGCFDGGNSEIWVDGVFYGKGNVPSQSLVGITIGAAWPPSNPSNNKISEAGGYRRHISTGEIILLNRFLATKYQSTWPTMDRGVASRVTPPTHSIRSGDAGSSVVSVNNTGFTGSGPFSVGGWFYVGSTGGTTSSFLSLVRIGATGVRQGVDIIIQSNIIKAYLEGWSTTTHGTLVRNAWHHFMLVCGSGTDVNMYVDCNKSSGTFTASTAIVNTPLTVLDSTASGAAQVSCRGVAFYPRALTQQEVTSLYLGQPPASATIYWPCQEGSGSTLYDTSGNANNGTVTGGTWDTVPIVGRTPIVGRVPIVGRTPIVGRG